MIMHMLAKISVALLVAGQVPMAAADEGWPLFRGDAASRAVAESALPERLDLLWQFEVEGGAFEGTATIVWTQPTAAKSGIIRRRLASRPPRRILTASSTWGTLMESFTV